MSEVIGFNEELLPGGKGAPEEKSRGFGDVLADIGTGALRGYAQGGAKGALAGAILGGIEGDTAQEMRNLQTENEQLRNQALQEQIRNSQQNYKIAQESHEDTRNLRKQQIENSKISGQIQTLQLARAQDESDILAIQKYQKEYTTANKKVLKSLNMLGQGIIKNDSGYQAAEGAYVIYRALQDGNRQLAERLMSSAGWTPQKDEKGNISSLVSSDGRIIPYNNNTMQMIMNSVNERARAGIVAAMAVGQDAATTEQYTLKNMLTSDSVKKYFARPDGNIDYGAALISYDKYIQDGIKNGTFNDWDLIGHQLGISLQAAVVDGKITQTEKALLLPQLDATLKSAGCELILNDGNIAHIEIKLANGTKVGLLKFADDLKKRDRVMSGWQEQLASNQAKKAAAALEMAQESAKLRKLNAEAVKAEGEAGLGNNGSVDETSDLDDTSKGLYNAGKEGIKEYGVSIPEVKGKSKKDLTIVFGTALTLAQQKFAETGSYSESQKTLASELDSVDWPKDKIPDLWGASGDKQEIEMLEKRNSYLRDQMNAKREKGDFRSSADGTLPSQRRITPGDVYGMAQAAAAATSPEDKDASEYKRNIDRIAELRKKQQQRKQSQKQADEYRKKSKEAGQLLLKAAKNNR